MEGEKRCSSTSVYYTEYKLRTETEEAWEQG